MSPIAEDEITPVEVVAPEPAEMHRDGDVGSPQRGGRCDYLAGRLHDLRHNLITDLRNDLSNIETYSNCLVSCAFFFICHALGVLLLNLCCCCRCLTFLVTAPECVEPANRTEKFFAFFAKHLSSLWVTTLLVLFARWVLFRPFDMKPHLGVSTVHEFDLAAVGGAHHLRFNLTSYLLFKNKHQYYNIRYQHLAVSVSYADDKLGPVDDQLPAFKQKPRGSTVMRLPLAGRLRNASDTVAETFAGESGKGALEMAVRIRVTQVYGLWPFKGEYFTIYDCPLSSPFPQNGEPALSSAAWCNTVDI